ncbi:MAG: alpha/beta hydrolase [Alphaproteobacteria bacterium]|uniref:Alpha/beta hydrolase n=1 Tax=Candidatus Nitrobium versatile TaxID=2884831 RepID=A0A953M1Y9_9BACT|nr:alpha/beta hydrolase [Candidatus Nitrobium versatile]
MPSAEVNGVRINYLQMPCESAEECEDLVMVHGLATSLAFWYFRHAPSFSKRYRITLYDLRGHGRSGTTDSGYTAKNMAVDLRKLLDHLGIEHAHFVAHSFGGAVALHLACHHPDRFASLVVADTHISAIRRLQKGKGESGERIQQILDRNNLDLDAGEPYFGYRLLSAVARLKVKNRNISPELEGLVRPLLGENSKRTARQWLRLIETSQAEKELMGDDGISPDRLRGLHFPIQAMYGERSPAMSTGERLLELWPHADFRRIREAGHFFPITRSSEFIENCCSFWKDALLRGIPRRKGDSDKRYFRSNRFYRRDGEWFFDTRESMENGPFRDLVEAKSYMGGRSISRMATGDHPE